MQTLLFFEGECRPLFFLFDNRRQPIDYFNFPFSIFHFQFSLYLCRMTFSVTILGAASAKPSTTRHQSSQLINHCGQYYLIDAGEGVQSRLLRVKCRRDGELPGGRKVGRIPLRCVCRIPLCHISAPFLSCSDMNGEKKGDFLCKKTKAVWSQGYSPPPRCSRRSAP